ncbi:MAG: GAF domain-containing protein [Chloroflexi bacterium]|nr:GAF domain-containing protein [Chloroflexota bacterium]
MTSTPTGMQSTEAVAIEINELKPLLTATEQALLRQSELLRSRGLGLPSMTHTAINSLIHSLDTFLRILRDEQREVAQLRTLVANSASFSGSFDLDEILSDAMDGIITMTGAERGCIILVDDAGNLDFHVLRDGTTAANRGQVLDGSNAEQQFSRSIINRAMETGEALLTHNAHDDQRLVGMQSVAALDLRSVLCAPLRYRDDMLGVVYVDNRLRSGVFGEREKALLVAFANQVAVAMSNARLFNNLQATISEITQVKELTDNVYNSIDSGVITIDGEGFVVQANRAAADLLDRPDPNALNGQPVADLLEPVLEPLARAITQVNSGARESSFEATATFGSKPSVVINVRVNPLVGRDVHGAGHVIVLEDLTVQRERAETLRMFKYYLPPEMVDNIQQIAGLGFEGERREVSCMYVDVRPLATMPAMRPQLLMEEVNIYLSRATDCIHEAGGMIDKYMGTEIMALFNTQLNPLANHAACAINAALQIHENFAVIYDSLGIDQAQYRIGINTGVATLGNVGSNTRRDFTAIGDAINLAKRLEESALDGQIVISEDVRTHAEQHPLPGIGKVEYHALEPLQVRGRQQQTAIYLARPL